MGNRSNKKKRDDLYAQSPNCRRCGVETVIGKVDMWGVSASNTCTIQHNKPKGHPNYSTDYTLWCYACNQEDVQFKQAQKIFSKAELVQYLTDPNNCLQGFYVVDGIVHLYDKHKLVETENYIDFKFKLLKRHMNLFIESLAPRNEKISPYTLTFEEFVSSYIKAEVSITKYKLSGKHNDGWYCYY